MIHKDTRNVEINFTMKKKRKRERERERERERGKKEKKNVDAKINWLLFLREVTYTNLRARDAMARHKY